MRRIAIAIILLAALATVAGCNGSNNCAGYGNGPDDMFVGHYPGGSYSCR